MDRVILHADLNNFYASVECLYNPALRGKPVAVAGDPEARHGIVLAKNYEAKRCGVQTGDPLWRARQLCRDIVFVPPHFELYLQYSRLAQDIYAGYTDQVEPFGLDECWLDVTGSAGLYGDGKRIADELRGRIKSELGVTASVGVSFNKIFAKLGSDYQKPDATTVIPSDRFQQTIWPLPVGELLYVGQATQRKLERYGIRTIGQLAAEDVRALERLLGKIGVMLWRFANGLDSSPVTNLGAKSLIKSVGNSTTTPRDLVTDEEVQITLRVLCESVSARLRECGFLCRTVQLGVRDNELRTYERQGGLSPPDRTVKSLLDRALALYRQNRPVRPVRSLSVRACNLSVPTCEQLTLLPAHAALDRQERLDSAVDAIRGRFGHFSLQRGLQLTDPLLSHLDPKNDHVIHPEGFLT